MPDQLSFGRTVQTLQQVLRIARDRHSVIAANISNVDTPGYRPRDIDFQKALGRAMDSADTAALTRTHEAHIAADRNSASAMDIDEDAGEWNGINHVNLDREIGKLAENNLTYRSGVEVMLRRIAALNEVIREGGK